MAGPLPDPHLLAPFQGRLGFPRRPSPRPRGRDGPLPKGQGRLSRPRLPWLGLRGVGGLAVRYRGCPEDHRPRRKERKAPDVTPNAADGCGLSRRALATVTTLETQRDRVSDESPWPRDEPTPEPPSSACPAPAPHPPTPALWAARRGLDSDPTPTRVPLTPAPELSDWYGGGYRGGVRGSDSDMGVYRRLG